MMLDRRSLITGLISLVVAPAIVRAGSLMPVKAMEPTAVFTSYGGGFNADYDGITPEKIAELMRLIRTQPVMVPEMRIVPPDLYKAMFE
jgi:hypothetical protein